MTTWPELIAVQLAERDGTTVMLPKGWEPVECEAGCGGWACVALSGTPVWCLSCWLQVRIAVQGQPAGAIRDDGEARYRATLKARTWPNS